MKKNAVRASSSRCRREGSARQVGMTQEQFAARFDFSTATLRHWERGDRTPRSPALVLLNVIERNPQAVIDALA